MSSEAINRLAALFDDGVYTELEKFFKNSDKPCEVITAYGTVGGIGVYAFSQDVTASFGAMGKAQAAKIMRVYELAAKTGAPVVGIYDSNGAHIDEGMDAMKAFGELMMSAAKVSGVVPQIAVVAGPCLGCSAVMAAEADVVIMTKDAELCVDASAEKEIGSAKTASENGTAAIITETAEEAVKKAVEVLSYLPENNLAALPMAEYVEAEGGECPIMSVVDAGSFAELTPEFGGCMVTGFARIGGNSVGVVACHTKDSNGLICKRGASKAARFVRLCDSFSLPIVTLVNAKGFKAMTDVAPGMELKGAAQLAQAYAEATSPKISYIFGDAVGMAYIALAGKNANSDYVIASSDAFIAPLSEGTAVQFLKKDELTGDNREALEADYRKVNSALKAAEDGVIDDVVEKADAAAAIISALTMLETKRVSTLDKKHTNMPL